MTRSAPRPADSPPDRKATLFCPSCDHASPVDGDWVVHECRSTLEYRCPDCDTRITERERGREGGNERENGRPVNPAVRLLSAWLRAATAWIRPFEYRRTRV